MVLSLTSWPDAMTWIMIISVMLISVFSIWIIFFWLALQSMLQSPKLKSKIFKRNVQDGREIESKRKSDKSKRRLPVISIILPTRNEQENIKKCIDSLVRQDY